MKKSQQPNGLLFTLMRITIVQCFLVCLCVGLSWGHDGNAQQLVNQKVNLTGQNQPIKKLLQQLEKQVNTKFVFSSRIIQSDRRISVDIQNAPLGDALDKLLKPIQLTYEVSADVIIIKPDRTNSTGSVEEPVNSAGAVVVDIAVSGTISDETGQGLPGVSIVVKGTQRGVTSDVQGHYQINVADGNAVLVFSYVGYQSTEETVGSRSVISVKLAADTKSLNEVVVVGYGTQSRRNVTGAVTKVDLKQTENLPNTNITQSLRGRVAGLQFTDNGRPGQGGTIQIRGQRSLSGGNDPLIILDGSFFNGDFADINPNDVESMEVLKDASATAIYGSRAANGVILVTSKKGVSEKPTIRFNAYYGVSDWSHRMKLYSPESYLQRILDYRTAFGQPSDPTKIGDYLQSTERERYQAGQTVDPWDVVSQKASQQVYNLSVSGRSGKTNYLLSAAYTDEKGLIINDNAKRITLRSNLENQVTPWLRIGLNSQFARRDVSGIRANVQYAYWLSPYAKLYYDQAQTDPVPYPVVDQLETNPIWASSNRQNENILYNLFANTFAIVDIPFVKGLTYRLNYNPNYRWEHNYTFIPIYNRTDLAGQPGSAAASFGSATKFNQERFSWQTENILTYTKRLNDKHEFDLTLLYGRSKSSLENTSATATNLFNDANGWNNLGIGATQQIVTDASTTYLISSMARLNYRFMSRYLLTLTARRDGYSAFGTNNKYGTFPSAALAWVASGEPFIQAVPAINLLKLRLSYGSVGNQAVSAYQSLDKSVTTQYVFGDGSATYTGIYPNTANMPNPNLGWETTTGANLGIDFELLKGRIGGAVELYDTKTNNLLQSQTVSPITGYSSQFINIGQTGNRGIELTLNTVNYRRDKWEWTSNIVFASNRNQILHLTYADVNKDGVEDDNVANGWFIGRPINVAYDYVFDGVYQTGETLPTGYKPGWVRVQDVNGDGKITTDDRTIIGQRDPKYRWGFTNTVRYGGLSLTVFLNAMQGFLSTLNMLDVSDIKGGGSYPGRPVNMLDAGYWTPDNKSTTRPGLNFTNPLGMNFYQNRDFVRIQDVALAYDFPKALTNRWKLTNLRVYVSGKNLATFTKWMGPDPESGNNTLTNLYPTPRTIVGGINVSF